MRIIVESVKAQMVNAKLSLNEWLESINILLYIKNRSFTSAVYEETITSIQNFHRGKPPNVNHIRIFGNETNVFHEYITWPETIPKILTGYLVDYG